MIVAIMRIFISGKKFLEREIRDDENAAEVMEKVATDNLQRLIAEPHLIEVEDATTPDDPNRFLRFGTDPKGMVMPIKLKRPPEGPGN